MRRHREDLAPMASMNLTSLLDITFVLLIAFMIVAPTLKHGLEIDLAQVKDIKPLNETNPLTVSIRHRKDPDELPDILLDNRRVTLEELRTRVQARYERQPNVNVNVRCDEREPSGVFLKVIASIQSAGVQNIGLEAEPE